MADTFCVHPWKYLWVQQHGGVAVCCKYTRRLMEEHGREYSLYTHPLEGIWNSVQLREMRRAMARGEPVAGCEQCYAEEAANGFSLRTTMNEYWRQGWLTPEGKTARQFLAEADARDYALDAPDSLYLSVGNLCNLKCRMCDGYSSSRIERDPVHGAWVGQPGHDPRYVAFTEQEHWFRRPDIVRQDLLRDPGRLRFLSFAGGETLLIKEVGDCLQHLVDEGAAGNIALELVTNATHVQSPWLELTRHFQNTRIVLSVDGVGEYYEYIRYPARWEKVAQNIARLRENLPWAEFDTSITFQTYNALNVTELFEYLDSVGLHFYINILDTPFFLQPQILPAPVRREAARRLRRYALTARAEYQEWLHGLAGGLEAEPEGVRPDALKWFMIFTNDLDASRKQRFERTHREMVELLAAAGHPWRPDTWCVPGPTQLPEARQDTGGTDCGDIDAESASRLSLRMV